MRSFRVLVLAGSLMAMPTLSAAQQPVPGPLPKAPLPPAPQQFRDLLVRESVPSFTPSRLPALHVTNATSSAVEIVLLQDHGLSILARLAPGAGTTLAGLPAADDLWLRLFARRAGDHALLDLSHWSLTPADTTWCTVRRGKVRERYIISS